MYGQKNNASFDTYHKYIYLEVLGSHLLIGVNYGIRLNKGRMDGVGFRAGVDGLQESYIVDRTYVDVGIITFPLEFNHLKVKKRSSFLTGLGLFPIYVSLSAEGNRTNYDNIYEDGFGIAGAFLNLGYRYQPLKTGLMFQLNWDPILLRGSGFKAGWLGIGLGYVY